MKRLTSIFLVLAMLLTLAPMNIFAADAESSVFSDMRDTDYYAQAAMALAQLDILAGYPDGTFGAEKSITRAEMAAIVCRMIDKEADAEKAKGETIFDDVKSDHWASGYINIAANGGIISGDGNGKFRPEDDVKYEEAIKMVVCALGFAGGAVSDPSDWSKVYLDIAEEKEITTKLLGKKGEPATRGDIAVMAYSGIQAKETPEKDEEEKKDSNFNANDKNVGSLPSGGRSPSVPSGPAPTPDDGTFVVSFDLNYEGATGAPASQTVNSGDKAIEPESPIRQTHAFSGWYDSNDELFDFNTAITSDIALKAKWIDLTDTTDTDGDGLIDTLEDYHKTNKTLSDTDGDGLTDFIELSEMGTNPIIADTDDDGVNDGNEDADEDSLSNIEEITSGTNPIAADTDNDGLIDSDEKTLYATNPLISDTDSDGVSDGKEIELGTNPLEEQATFSMNLSAANDGDGATASVQMNLSGEQVETLIIEPVNDETFFPKTMPGYMGQAYDFNVEGEFDSANISFEFDESELSPDADPVIYYFNEETQELEELPTTVIGNVATATVSHFSKYILIDRTIYEESFKWIDVWDSTQNYTGVEIILVIDDSGSMDSNDRTNQRLTVAQNMVDKLPQNSKIGIVQFESDTTILTQSLTDDKETAKSYLTTSYFKSNGSTYMYNAINDAFALYENTDESILKVMVVLSDGNTSDTRRHTDTITYANSNDIKIYTVGLGSSTSYFNNYLKPLAVNTAAAFYLASDAEQLEEIYNNISQKIDIETDADNDGIPDYYEDNMIIFSGVSLALDKNSPDTDGDGIIDGDELELKYEYNTDRTKVKVTGKLFADPTVAYSDGDAYDDYSEIYIYNTNPFERNVIIDDSYLSLLTNDDFYYASSYRDRYENEALLRASIWVGNNVYGSNHSEKLIYKQALLKYFEMNNDEYKKRQEIMNAADIANDCIGIFYDSVENALDYAASKNYVDAQNYLNSLLGEMDTIKKSISDMKYTPGTSTTDFYNKMDELSNMWLEVATKSDELSEAIEGAKNTKKISIKIPSKLSGALEIIDIGSTALTIAMPSFQAYSDAISLSSNIDTIKGNIYMLNAIINSTDNTALRDAAIELKSASQSKLDTTLHAIDQALENTGYAILDVGCHTLIGAIPVVGFWIELGLGVADLLIPVSDSSKEGLTIYGMAKTADSLSTDLVSYLSSGKQNDTNGNVIYAMYGEKANNSVNRFVNFADMRIYGEQKMIDLQKLSADWLKSLLKLFGTDSAAVIADCEGTQNTINGFKNMYVGKY